MCFSFCLLIIALTPDIYSLSVYIPYQNRGNGVNIVTGLLTGLQRNGYSIPSRRGGGGEYLSVASSVDHFRYLASG